MIFANTSLVLITFSKLVNSIFNMASVTNSTIILPHAEIDALWFGDLDLQPGKAPSMNAMMRWFRTEESFDTHCRFFL
jgi:hypothetical protein